MKISITVPVDERTALAIARASGLGRRPSRSEVVRWITQQLAHALAQLTDVPR